MPRGVPFLNAPNAQVLLQRGGKFDVRDDNGRTPLTFAAERCDADVVRYLMAIQRAAQHNKGLAPEAAAGSPSVFVDHHMERLPEFQQVDQARAWRIHLVVASIVHAANAESGLRSLQMLEKQRGQQLELLQKAAKQVVCFLLEQR